MKPYWTNGRAVLWQGHVLDCLAAMDAESVHCVVTSPPYWGLRSYPCPPVEWPPVRYAPMAGLAEIDVPGCDPECEHVWGEERTTTQSAGYSEKPTLSGFTSPDTKGRQMAQAEKTSQGSYCQRCGGWRGSLGLEPTVEMFVGHLVLVARELWRVLRDDGTFWLNLGDSYSGSWGNYAPGGIKNEQRPQTEDGKRYERPAYSSTTFLPPTANCGLKPKDLIGIPWRCALALQADGWYLRSDVIWAKGVSFCPTYSGSCMPESVRDRPTKGHEYVFLLSKNKSYYYDADAVRGRGGDGSTRWGGPVMDLATDKAFGGDSVIGQQANRPMRTFEYNGTRNLRSVWTINPSSYAKAHYAVFPPALVEPIIRAGTSERGVCPKCGAPWERVTERVQRVPWEERKNNGAGKGSLERGYNENHGEGTDHTLGVSVTTTGWTPTCQCNAGEPIPATVLDPFLGSGTTAAVADQLNRHSVGIELSREYCDEHIIPRLLEPLFDLVEPEPEPEAEPEPMQLEMQL